MNRFPFGIPNGWFPVCYSDELAAGEVRRMHYFDSELVAFRSEDGVVAVLDAYCAHLGAHLGVGGRVVGSSIRCPFHGWRFDAHGSCVEIPYARSAQSARVFAWPVVERNGIVLVWHHAERRLPYFEIPTFPEWQAPDWTVTYERYSWQVRTHPQEVMENAIDWQHFHTVHGMAAPKEKGEAFAGSMFRWYVGTSKNVALMECMRDDFLVDAQNWGLGFSWLYYSGRYKTVVVTGITPIDRETTEIRFGILGKRDGRSDAGLDEGLKAYMHDQAAAIQQDFPIWENKCYRPHPALCEEDGPILEFRSWARQFYSGAEDADRAGAGQVE